MKIRLQGIYPYYESDIKDALREMLVEYTALKKIIKVVLLKEMKEEFAYAFATSTELWGNKLQYEIKLNPEAFSKPDICSLFAMTSGAYYYSVKSIIYHEIGHCLQLFMPYEKLGLPLKKYNRFSAKKYYTTSRSLIEKEYLSYFKSFYDLFQWNEDDIITHLGFYASEKPMELLPECFNLYYSLKNKAHRNKMEEERYQFSRTVIENYKENYL